MTFYKLTYVFKCISHIEVPWSIHSCSYIKLLFKIASCVIKNRFVIIASVEVFSICSFVNSVPTNVLSENYEYFQVLYVKLVLWDCFIQMRNFIVQPKF